MKAATEIVAMLIIVIISIALFSAVYLWGRPLIEKRQYASQVAQTEQLFDQTNSLSLPSKIEYIANKGGQEIFRLETPGAWALNESGNYIQFSFFSKTSPYAPDVGWISLTPAESCPPSSGIVGKAKPSVVCVKSEKVADGYQITYRVYFRDLLDEATGKTYRIKLQKHPGGPLTSSGKTVSISRGQTVQTQQLIETDVIILLG